MIVDESRWRRSFNIHSHQKTQKSNGNWLFLLNIKEGLSLSK